METTVNELIWTLIPDLTVEESKWCTKWTRGALDLSSSKSVVPVEVSVGRLISRASVGSSATEVVELQSLINRLMAKTEEAPMVLRFLDLIGSGSDVVLRESESLEQAPIVELLLLGSATDLESNELKEFQDELEKAAFGPVITEQDVVKDLVYVLQGIDGKYITLDDKTHTRVHLRKPLKIAVVPFIEQSIRHIAQVGATYKRIVKLLSCVDEPSVLFLAFKSGVVKQLRAHLSFPALVDSDIKQWTLLKLVAWLTVPQFRLEFLAQTVDAVCADPTKVLAIIHEVKKRRATFRSLMDAIFSDVLIVWLEMVEQWTTRGKLGMSDFFIRLKNADEVRPAKLRSDRVEMDVLWNDTFEIHNRPEFITRELANSILVCGKNAALLAACGQTLPYNPEFSFKSIENLEADVEDISEILSRRVMDLVLNKNMLMNRLDELKRFVLLAQGDFADNLLKMATKELIKPVNEVNRFELRYMIDCALRQSVMNITDVDGLLNRLDVGFGLQIDPSDTGFEIFYIDYLVEDALEVVVSPDVMQQYRQFFMFLWRVLRAENALGEVWRDLQAVGRHQNVFSQLPNVEALVRKANVVRAEIWWFIHTLRGVMSYEIVDPRWNEFITKVETCRTLDEIVRIHSECIDSLSQGLLHNKNDGDLREKIGEILGVALRMSNAFPSILAELSTSVATVEDVSEFRFSNIMALLDDFSDVFNESYNTFMDLIEERATDGFYQTISERFTWNFE